MSFDTLGLTAVQGLGAALPELASGRTDLLSATRPVSAGRVPLLAMRPVFNAMRDAQEQGDHEGFEKARRLAVGGVTTAAALDILDAGDAMKAARRIGDLDAMKLLRSRQVAAVGTVLLMKWLTERMRPGLTTDPGTLQL